MLSEASKDNILALKEGYQKLWWPVKWLFFPRKLDVALAAIRDNRITEAQALAVCMAFPKHIWFFQRWFTSCLETFLSSPLGYTVNALNKTKIAQTAYKSQILSSILTKIEKNNFGIVNAISAFNTKTMLDGEHALDYFSAAVEHDSPPSAADFLISLKQHGAMESATQVHTYCNMLKQNKASSYYYEFDKTLPILAPTGLLHDAYAPNLVEMLLNLRSHKKEMATIIVRIQQILARTQDSKPLLEYILLLRSHGRRYCLLEAFDCLSDLLAGEDAPLILDTLLHDSGNPIYCANALILLHQARAVPGPNSAEYLAVLANRDFTAETDDAYDIRKLHQHDLLNLDNFKFVLSFLAYGRHEVTNTLTCLKDLNLLDNNDTTAYQEFLNESNVSSDTPKMIRSLELPSKRTAPVIIKVVVKNPYSSEIVSGIFNQLHTLNILDDTNTTHYANILKNCYFRRSINYGELVTELHTLGCLQDQFEFVLTHPDPKRAIGILRDDLKVKVKEINSVLDNMITTIEHIQGPDPRFFAQNTKQQENKDDTTLQTEESLFSAYCGLSAGSLA